MFEEEGGPSMFEEEGKAAPVTRPIASEATKAIALRPPAAQEELAVLLLHPEPELLDEVAALLRRRSVPVHAATDAAGARRLLGEDPAIGVMLTDVRLLEADGLVLAAELLNGRGPHDAVELLLIAGGLAAEDGQFGIVQEGLRLRDVAANVGRALAKAAARRTLGRISRETPPA
jgi:DNA-binding NtrC family response regulator